MPLVKTLPDVPKHSHTAMVADTDIGFQMISLYAKLRGNIAQAMGAFRGMESALEWLAVPGATTAIPKEVAAVLNPAFCEEDRHADGFQISVTKVVTGQASAKAQRGLEASNM